MKIKKKLPKETIFFLKSWHKHSGNFSIQKRVSQIYISEEKAKLQQTETKQEWTFVYSISSGHFCFSHSREKWNQVYQA